MNNEISDETLAILREMQAMGMGVGGRLVEEDPRIDANLKIEDESDV